MRLNEISSRNLDFARRIKNIDPRRAAIMLSAAFFLFYVYLSAKYPVLYWTDAHNRLARRGDILIGYWLPMMQALVFISLKISGNLLFLRSLLSLITAGVLFCAYFLASRVFSSTAGLIAMALLGTNLLYAAMATVPYSEVLFIGLIFLALGFLADPIDRRSACAGILTLNLACLTRYEGWLLAGILVIEETVRCLRPESLNRLWSSITRMTLFVFAPVGWMVFIVSEPGGLFGRLGGIFTFTTGYPVEALVARFVSRMNMEYVFGFAGNYFNLIRWQAGAGILLFGLFGWVRALRSSSNLRIHLRITLFLFLVWFLIAFWGPWDFTQLRQVFIGEMFLILYAAYGLEQLAQRIPRRVAVDPGKINPVFPKESFAFAFVIASMLFYIPSNVNFVAQTSQEPKYSVPAAIGFWLDARLKDRDVVLALTDDPFQIDALASYISLPLDAILDDRFEEHYIESRLDAAEQIYVIPLYESRDGLSVNESKLLEQFETTQIPASKTTVAGREIWVCSDECLVVFIEMIRSE